MVGALGAQVGLLAFAVALIVGLAANNAPTVVLTRALLALVGGAVAGQAAGWAAKTVLREYLQKRKLDIDREHFAAMQALNRTGEGMEPAEAPERGKAG